MMLQRILLFGLLALLMVRNLEAAAASGRPNILWITCEDTSPHLGCYGDALADTPHLDALASQSVRYTQAFAYTGVCAPSRSCLITGVYPLRLGSQNMRSTTRLPDRVKCFTEYLRDAGYYCSNNSKEDYNFTTPTSAWDESGKTAHWRGRADDQPFFAVFNLSVSHQGQIFGPDRKAAAKGEPPPPTVHDTATINVPPIHPDTAEFRREWARHYDNVTRMDAQAGALLRELEADGLTEDTVVFFFSDHGTGMPSIKMFAWGPSLQVPLLVRFPEKWRSLQPGRAGDTIDRLVGFVDFAPTVLVLAGVAVPVHMQGTAFLGQAAGAPRRFIFGGKDRQAECTDTIRYVRDHRFQYNRNFRPELPFGQHMSYTWQHASTRAWEQLHEAGKLSGAPARFFAATKPIEELYDVTRDPWQVNNLAGDSVYAEELNRLRTELFRHMKQAGDLGLLPEREMHTRGAQSTPYEIAADPNLNPIDDLLGAAGLANEIRPQNVAALIELLVAEDSAVRWWGVLGLVALKSNAAPAEAALRRAIRDESLDVRLAAAEALANLGRMDEALPVLREALNEDDVFVRLSALQVIGRLGSEARSLLPAVRAAGLKDPQHKHISDYVGRMVAYLPDQI